MRSGDDYIEALRDGRRVLFDGEVVEDVTTHPAFAGAVRSVARLYDIARSEPAVLMCEPPEGGEPRNVCFLVPRSTEDLTRRRMASRRWAEASFGLIGRSPDHVASFITGFAASAELFGEYADNVRGFHRLAAERDLYVTYVIAQPQIDRSKPAHQQADPFLYAGVKEERDGGIVIAGAQQLGTGTAISDWVLLSNIFPLQAGDEPYAISCVVPVGAPGLKVYPRRSYASGVTSLFDYPLSSRFDETDALVVFDDVFVPWEHVFVYRDIERCAAQWWETPGHVLGNHQAQTRFSVKLDFLVGLAKRITDMIGTGNQPGVQAVLGELAAHAALLHGLLAGSERDASADENGVFRPEISQIYAAMTLQSTIYPRLIATLRELCGSGVIALPSSSTDFGNAEMAADIERYIQSPGYPAHERVKLLRLAWDFLGSEMAGRHQQYELFYGGAPFLVKLRMFRSFDFERATSLVDDALTGYDLEAYAGTTRS